ncbi:hypothetical protein ACWDRB_66520 [Nonomuraea sp. NPDC003707]
MRQFFASITPRERRFAAAGTIIALVLLVPVVAVADPGLIPGGGPGDPVDSGTEQAVDAKRGDSCRNMLAADTPQYVVCRWLTPPQDAAAVAAFWGADGGANLEAAQPLPVQYVRCNQKTDLSKTSTCRGGQTFCKQLPSGWYQCKNLATGKTTYERYNGKKKVVRNTPPPAGATATPSPAPSSPTASATATSTTTPSGNPTIDASDLAPLPPDGNPAETGTTPTQDPAQSAAPAVPTVTSEPTTSPTNSSEPATTSPGGSPVTDAIAAAKTARLRVWVESNLADDYQEGDTQFQAALRSLITAAKQPGVVGVKFADNLGYSGFTSDQEVTTFLARATSALRTALPGKRLAISVVVPELGCGSSQPCIEAMRAKAPLASKQRVDHYLKVAGVDRVEIASGLFGRALAQYQVTDPKTRKATSITPAMATQAQWMSIKVLGWDTLAQIGSREYGLAHEGDTSGWDKATATAQIDARVGSAIGLGVPTVTLWGHHAADRGQTYRLLDAGLAANQTWTVLTGLRARLAAVFDPSSVDVGVSEDIAALGKGTSEIFILT